ncbi:hypothetical protein BD770DRAFT_411938 [Pilaira anomala]|nr:hypothetical protein BD770DRAFT_411938 [Pilaira anomala]
MTFSVLSLKRNRSSSHNDRAVSSKLSKIKSGLSKLTSSIITHPQQEPISDTRRTSFIGLFQYFRPVSSTQQQQQQQQQGTTNLFDHDRHYEYTHYHNRHTLPTHTTPKLTGILIKRSDTTPTSTTHHKQTNKRSRAQSNLTVNSEDLTAKEFANIAGIRILPEITTTSSLEQQQQQQRKFTIVDEDLELNTIASNYYTTLSLNEFNIWDNQFWSHPHPHHPHHHPEVQQPQQQQQQQQQDDRDLLPSSIIVDPPILHELRRMGTTEKEFVIKKGRFEIQLNSTTTTTNNNNNNNNNITTTRTEGASFIQWKRKEKLPL